MREEKIVTWVFALTVIAANVVASGEALAQEEKRAAVLPAFGDLGEDKQKEVTIEVRKGIREQKYGLATQASVKEAIESRVLGEIPTVGEMISVAQAVRANIVIAPRLVARPGKGVYLEVVGFDLDAGRHRGFRAKIKGVSAISEATPEKLKPVVAVCLAAVLEKKVDPKHVSTTPPVQIDLSGAKHEDPETDRKSVV